MTSEAIRELYHELRRGGVSTAGDAAPLHEVESDDPGVLGRFESEAGRGPLQRVTGFRALPAPAASYPPGLPFIPHLPVFVTEFPEAWDTPCVRWLVGWGRHDVFDRVVAACRAGGWEAVAGMGEVMPFPGRRTVLRRRGEVWLALEHRRDDGRTLVQLLGMV